MLALFSQLNRLSLSAGRRRKRSYSGRSSVNNTALLIKGKTGLSVPQPPPAHRDTPYSPPPSGRVLLRFILLTTFTLTRTGSSRLTSLARPVVPKDKQSCTFINYLTQTNKTFDDNSNWPTDNIQPFYAFKEFLCYLWPATILSSPLLSSQ